MIAYLRETARDWFRQMYAWDIARKQDLVRAAMAKSYGLDPAEYTRPFPGSMPASIPPPPDSTVSLPASAPPAVPPTAAGAGAGFSLPWAAALAASLGLGAGGGYLLATRADRPAAVAPQPPAEGVKTKIYWWIEDGEMKMSDSPPPKKGESK